MSLSPPLKTELMNIFFDESGQDSDKPSSMGGLLIPTVVYNSAEMINLNQKLVSGQISLHWTEYTGHAKSRENIKEAIKVFSLYARYSRMNVINYNRSTLDERYKLSGDAGTRNLLKVKKRKS